MDVHPIPRYIRLNHQTRWQNGYAPGLAFRGPVARADEGSIPSRVSHALRLLNLRSTCSMVHVRMVVATGVSRYRTVQKQAMPVLRLRLSWRRETTPQGPVRKRRGLGR